MIFFPLLLFPCFIVFSLLVSGADGMTTLIPKTFYSTGSVTDVRSCVKSIDESFAIYASQQNIVIRFNLQPFALALTSDDPSVSLYSCDLYEETGNPSASKIVAAKGYTPSTINFYDPSTLATPTTISASSSEIQTPRVM